MQLFFKCYCQNNRQIKFQYTGGCDSHFVFRKFLSDSIFVDSSIIENYFKNRITIIDTFKKENFNWYYLNNNQWVLYFSKEKFNKREIIYWWGETFGVNPNPPFTKAIPLRSYNENNSDVYVYKVEEINDAYSHILEYHFEYNYGVIKIFDNSEEKKCQLKILKRVTE